MGRLFGTDGVRGVANRELTPQLAFAVGRAFAGHVLEQGQGRPCVLVGRDTRLSGPMLEGALVAGIASTGVDVSLAGVTPTPAVALLARKKGAAGVAITASHNPAADNGIKLFGADGFKLSIETEADIEQTVRRILSGNDRLPTPTGGAVGRIAPLAEAAAMYIEALIGHRTLDLSGLHIVLDSAHGATVPVAGELFRRLGATVSDLSVEPDGLNINVKCGATEPAMVAEAVHRLQAHLGFAFDGDGDRVIAVDERGRVVDGDHILAIAALHLLSLGRLPHKTIVATEYSNLGLTEAVEDAGGRVVTAGTGDRNVVQEMRRGGYILGGEQSGHIIFLEESTTGDGLLTALQVCQILKERGLSLSALRDQMRSYPQLLVNVPVRSKEWEENVRVAEVVARVRSELQGEGRLFVRASGTEPLIRIMGEGRDKERVRLGVEEVAAVVREELGG